MNSGVKPESWIQLLKTISTIQLLKTISTIQLFNNCNFNYSNIQGHIEGLRGIGDTGGTVDIVGIGDIRGTVDIGDIGNESDLGLYPSFRLHPHSALWPLRPHPHLDRPPSPSPLIKNKKIY